MVDHCNGPEIELLSTADPTHGWNEKLCDRHLERDRVFQLVASLANLLDKSMIVETMTSVLGTEPVEVGDCILFDGLSIKFGNDGRVIGLSQTFDGSAEPAKSIIQSISDNEHAT
jgi:hypothetical protein